MFGVFLSFSTKSLLPLPVLMCWFTDYTEGAELVDAVLDVVRKEAEGTDCLQGNFAFAFFPFRELFLARDRFPNHAFSWWWYWCWHGYSSDF